MNKHAGFKILDFIQSQNWKVLEVTDAIDLVSQKFCPADTSSLKTICTLVGQNGRQRLRIGCCQLCGYVGYIDRPEEEWSVNFYFDTYALSKRRTAKNPHTDKSRRKLDHLISLLQSLSVDKSRAVCEIGCGTGGYLDALRREGFSRLIGIENSRERAKLARQDYNLSVLTAPFESSESISQLEKQAPFSLMYSHHVLEHVYDPAKLVAAASHLQQDGDWFINSLPNFYAEPTLAVLLFLPHLHSFTKESFSRLLAREGYEIVNDAFTSEAEIYLAARKTGLPTQRQTSKPVKTPLTQKDYFKEALTKLTKGLGLMGDYGRRTRYLRFVRKMDGSLQSTVPLGGHLPLVNKLFCRVSHKSDKGKHYCLVVEDLAKRYVSEKESPLEIQFEGNIKLFYK